MANKAVFTIAIGLTKAYALAIHGFVVASTWIFRTRETIRTHFVPQFASNFRIALVLKPIRLGVSKIILGTILFSTIQLRKIRIVTSTKLRMKALVPLILRIRLSAWTKAKQKITIPVRIKKIVLAFVPIVASFYTLGDYSAITLGVLDPYTLGALDYTL
jgi:hypothetical protein